MADPNQNPYSHHNIPHYSQNADNNPQNTYHSVYAEVNNNIEIQPSTISNYNTPELTTNGVCKKFIHGKCRQGEGCPYPHDKSKIKAC